MASTVSKVSIDARSYVTKSVDNRRSRGVIIYNVVLSGRANDNAATALTASAGGVSVLARGATDNIFASTLVCLDQVPRPTNGDPSGINWQVECSLGPNPFVGSATLAPWQRKDRLLDCSPVEYRKPLERFYTANDAVGTPTGESAANSAGDPWIPVLETEAYNSLVVIGRARKASDIDPLAAQTYVGSINSATFTIALAAGNKTIAANKAKLKFIKPREDNWEGTAYYDLQIGFELGYAHDLLTGRYIDRGFQAYIAGVKRWITKTLDDPANTGNPKKDFNGDTILVPVSTPQFLDGDGGLLDDNGTPVELTGQKGCILDWSSFIT